MRFYWVVSVMYCFCVCIIKWSRSLVVSDIAALMVCSEQLKCFVARWGHVQLSMLKILVRAGKTRMEGSNVIRKSGLYFGFYGRESGYLYPYPIQTSCNYKKQRWLNLSIHTHTFLSSTVGKQSQLGTSYCIL